MKYCCQDFKDALKREDIILVIKRNEYQFAGNLNEPDMRVRYCPYCGEKVGK